jgi:hypothetical protein
VRSTLRRALLVLSLLVPCLRAGDKAPDLRDVRFAPILLESAYPQSYRHGLSFRTDFAVDNFKTTRGTESVTGLYSRAQPSLEYRYSPGGVEVFFRALYTAQSVELRTADGVKKDSLYSAGAAQPSVGVKLPFASRAALLLHTAPPTTADRTPRLGDGAHYGGNLLLRTGRMNWSAGHTVRLPYQVDGASETFRRVPGAVTELGAAWLSRDIRTAKRDFVGTELEVLGIYTDRERLNGAPVRGSASMIGRGVFGFVLGKINPGGTHFTRVALSMGFGEGSLHRTQDPIFGVGDFHLTLGYAYLWGDR